METLSGGRLQVRNLRDPEVQPMLNPAHPNWRWEPMLVEIEGERVRVFAGLAMRARLVQVLGPVRALRVAQAGARMGDPVLGVDGGRRRLLRQEGGLPLPLGELMGMEKNGERWIWDLQTLHAWMVPHGLQGIPWPGRSPRSDRFGPSGRPTGR
ncbi:hypothetical protein [Thermoflexus hugenholtzii]